ncbi:hypothetical protein ACFWN5_37520 [Streptomyces sp. NPDC058430]|uniref:hypothetical protein n=1 Tax=Streptomyces sp. NPDC058430 TaxID=3346495 RepID=UPI003666AECE
MSPVQLPAFVSRLQDQTREPGEVPAIPHSEAERWLQPLAGSLLDWINADCPGAPPEAFLAAGYAHLPLPATDGQGLYLRLSCGSTWCTWPIAATSVVLTLAGAVDFEMYAQPGDARSSSPQYARSFGPEEAFAAHVGTLCALRSRCYTMQVLATKRPEPVPADGPRTLHHEDRVVFTKRAHRELELLVGGVR